MTFEFFVYPKKGLILKGTDIQICNLIETGILRERADGLAEFTQGINLSIVKLGIETLDKFIDEQWTPLFPTTTVNSGTTSYKVTGNRSEIVRQMRTFLQQYKTRFDFDCIFISTAAYLYDRAQKNFDYTLKSHNFIKRELEAWCLAYEQDPKTLYQKAKLYYEYVRRTATRARKGRVDAAEFGRTAILESIRDDVGGRVDNRPRTRPELGGEPDRHLRPDDTIEVKARAIRINKAHKNGAGNESSSS